MKGCCSPYIATILAGVLTIIESLRGLAWNLEIALLIGSNQANYSYSPPAITVSAVQKDHYVLYGIAIVSVFTYFLWLIFACLLLAGNTTKKRGLIWPWLCHTQFMLMFAVFVGVMYFVSCSQTTGASAAAEKKRIAYFRLGIGYSGWCYVWPFMNIVWTVFVVKRMVEITKEINREISAQVFLYNSDRMCCEPPPYSQAITTEIDEGTRITQSVSIFSSAPSRRQPPPRPPPPALNRISGWSQQNLLDNEVTQSSVEDIATGLQRSVSAGTTPKIVCPMNENNHADENEVVENH